MTNSKQKGLYSHNTDWETYVGPAMELIYERGSSEFRGQWPVVDEMLSIANYMVEVGDWDHPYLYLPRQREYYGQYESRSIIPEGLDYPRIEDSKGYEVGIYQDNPKGRLRAMDRLGVDRHVIHPSHSVNTVHSKVEGIAIGIVESYNKYIETFCSENPDRLKWVMQLYGGNPYWSSTEIKRNLNSDSLSGVSINLPSLVSPDHHEFDVLWEAISSSGLPLVIKKNHLAQNWTLIRIMLNLIGNDIFRKFGIERVILIGYESSEYELMFDAIDKKGLTDRALETNIKISSRTENENTPESNASLFSSQLKGSGFPFREKQN